MGGLIESRTGQTLLIAAGLVLAILLEGVWLFSGIHRPCMHLRAQAIVACRNDPSPATKAHLDELVRQCRSEAELREVSICFLFVVVDLGLCCMLVRTRCRASA